MKRDISLYAVYKTVQTRRSAVVIVIAIGCPSVSPLGPAVSFDGSVVQARSVIRNTAFLLDQFTLVTASTMVVEHLVRQISRKDHWTSSDCLCERKLLLFTAPSVWQSKLFCHAIELVDWFESCGRSSYTSAANQWCMCVVTMILSVAIATISLTNWRSVARSQLLCSARAHVPCAHA
eukprot:1050465-Pleurochrysis_carterae.AAC.1